MIKKEIEASLDINSLGMTFKKKKQNEVVSKNKLGIKPDFTFQNNVQ